MTKARKARPGKKFLARSQVSSRDGRGAHWAMAKEILGVALLALTTAGIISLISYSPLDPSGNTVSTGSGYENYLGRFGAWISDWLVQGLGFGAYLFPLITFTLALSCFVRVVEGWVPALVRVLGGAVLSLSLLGLGNLLFTRGNPSSTAPGPEGSSDTSW